MHEPPRRFHRNDTQCCIQIEYDVPFGTQNLRVLVERKAVSETEIAQPQSES